MNNPFRSTPDPDWDYFDLWNSLEIPLQQLLDIAEFLKDKEHHMADEGVSERLKKAQTSLQKAIDDFENLG